MNAQSTPIRREHGRKRALGAWRQRDAQLPLPFEAKVERAPLKVSWATAEQARCAPAKPTAAVSCALPDELTPPI